MKIPDNKKFFRIGEVSRIVGVEPYVLRYWESEFPQIRPSRADSRQRTYQRKDLETIIEIRKLLHEEKMTIEGARKRLKEGISSNISFDPRSFIKDLKSELEDIGKLLAE
jgi:DNA-binding transcriptional MerR regulator